METLDPANGKKPGKWTPEEDAKLIEAVKKHGKMWVLVAEMVPGRTNIQCSEHWRNSLDSTNGKKLGKWSTEEDVKLAEAVKKHGKKWVPVAAMVPSRTNQQCSKYWKNSLDSDRASKRVE
jgi:S-ribosylhomocysteine lyase LuxS involved in autoinducer biosynthesis